ncbi:MAG: tRNA-binding protein [SAR324 cluster bacterium]|nr:tRNA-binding protein [SAR324 cluster bacterium]
MEQITFDEFQKVNIRVGRITRVEDFPKARQPSYKIWIDFGPELGERKSSAKLTQLYSKEALLGRQIIAVVNFPRRQVADFMSDVLILGAMVDDETVVLLQPEREVPVGVRML